MSVLVTEYRRMTHVERRKYTRAKGKTATILPLISLGGAKNAPQISSNNNDHLINSIFTLTDVRVRKEPNVPKNGALLNQTCE